MSDFFRFPHTPHLAWLAAGRPREDKVFSPEEARAFLSADVIVEEKIDGANLGFSIDERGELRAQNRGRYLDLAALSGQWKPLRRWLASPRARALVSALSPGLILFGEWCYAVHSVPYTRLPDWFLAFDIYEQSARMFWSVERRNDFVRQLDLAIVPELGRGRYDLDALKGMLGTSRLSTAPAEGLYVRRETQGYLLERAKLVRAEFVQAIDEHWAKRALKPNQLDPATHGL